MVVVDRFVARVLFAFAVDVVVVVVVVVGVVGVVASVGQRLL